jgi:hypothetical protein
MCLIYHHHDRWQNSSSWAIPFLRKFCQISLFATIYLFFLLFCCRARSSALHPTLATWKIRSLYCIYVPSDRVTQFYFQAPASLFIALYTVSQSYGRDILTRLHTGCMIYLKFHTPNSSFSLLVALKPNPKYKFYAAAISLSHTFFSPKKERALIKVIYSYISKIRHNASLQDLI